MSNVVVTETEIKKSVFISQLAYIETEEDAARILGEITKIHYKAKHICYAYIINGETTLKKKYSDAGEPQGTAGRPILSVLEKKDLENVLCVVIRYFGGVKLGASGLTRAYAASAESAVKAAKIIRKRYCVLVEIICDYAHVGKIRSYLDAQDYAFANAAFSDTARLAVYLPLDECDAVLSELTELTNAKASYEKKKCSYREQNQ